MSVGCGDCVEKLRRREEVSNIDEKVIEPNTCVSFLNMLNQSVCASNVIVNRNRKTICNAHKVNA